jgi:hypothetical protein
MSSWLENFFIRGWNVQQAGEDRRPRADRVLDIGAEIVDGEPVRKRVGVEHDRRAEGMAIFGKTGSGKSALINHFAEQDIQAGRGFAMIDLHGDGSDFVLKTIANRERRLKADLSEHLIVIDPTDTEYSVGINLFESLGGQDLFLRIAAITEILIERWNLDHLGPRTAELLQNANYAVAENHLTLIDIARFLRDPAFRASCLRQVSNPEVKEYFELRYNQASVAMQAVMSEAILNKTSFFVSDPRFRHLLGQQRSTFSLLDALDRGLWILIVLHKGKLGPQAATLAALFLLMIRNALFARRNTKLFTLYCDEIQNLATFAGGFETILSEARKFGVGVVSANQFLDQHSSEMRAALLAVGTIACFQASGPDAQQIAAIFNGGKSLAENLKTLPRRHVVVKPANDRSREAIVPLMNTPRVDPSDLYQRVRARWARRRSEIEENIRERQQRKNETSIEGLHGWE